MAKAQLIADRPIITIHDDGKTVVRSFILKETIEALRTLPFFEQIFFKQTKSICLNSKRDQVTFLIEIAGGDGRKRHEILKNLQRYDFSEVVGRETVILIELKGA